MKQFRKRMLATGLAVTVIMGTTTPTIKVFANEQTKFNDVSDNHWAKAQIDAFIKEGIIAGYPDGSFKPSNQITRAEFVKIINKAFGFTSAGEITFTDVKEDAWYKTDVAIAVKAGYLDGFGDGTFRPNEEITREQMAKILGTILNVSGDGQTTFVDDAKIAPWAKKYVDGLAEKGLINGYKEDNTFRPQGNATRAEGVKLSSDSKVYKNKQDEIIENNQGTEKPDETPSNPKPSNPGSGTGTGGGGIIISPGDESTDDPYNNISESQKSTLSANATISDLKRELQTKTMVTITGNMKINETLNIEEGKVVALSDGVQLNIDSNSQVKLSSGAVLDVTKGEIVNNGTINLDGGELKTINDTTAKASARANETVKVKGGKLVVNNGIIKVNNLGEIQAEIQNVNKSSKLKIGELWVVHPTRKDTALTINSGTLNFKFGANHPELGKTHTMEVNGDLTFNDAWRTVVVKATKDAKLQLNGPANWYHPVALLYKQGTTYGYEEAYKGSYVGNADGSWTNTEDIKDQTSPPEPGETSPKTATVGTVTKTTDENVLSGDDITDKVKITSSSTNENAEETTGSIAIVEDNITIVATPASSETVTGIVLSTEGNDKSVKIDLKGKLTSGRSVTVKLTTSDIASILSPGENKINVTIVTTTGTINSDDDSKGTVATISTSNVAEINKYLTSYETVVLTTYVTVEGEEIVIPSGKTLKLASNATLTVTDATATSQNLLEKMISKLTKSNSSTPGGAITGEGTLDLTGGKLVVNDLNNVSVKIVASDNLSNKISALDGITSGGTITEISAGNTSERTMTVNDVTFNSSFESATVVGQQNGSKVTIASNATVKGEGLTTSNSVQIYVWDGSKWNNPNQDIKVTTINTVTTNETVSGSTVEAINATHKTADSQIDKTTVSTIAIATTNTDNFIETTKATVDITTNNVLRIDIQLASDKTLNAIEIGGKVITHKNLEDVATGSIVTIEVDLTKDSGLVFGNDLEITVYDTTPKTINVTPTTVKLGTVEATTSTDKTSNATTLTTGVTITSGATNSTVSKTTGSIATTATGLTIVATPATTETLTHLVLETNKGAFKVDLSKDLTSSQSVTVELTTKAMAEILENATENTINLTIITTKETASVPENKITTVSVATVSTASTTGSATPSTVSSVTSGSTSDTAQTTWSTVITTNTTGDFVSLKIVATPASATTISNIVLKCDGKAISIKDFPTLTSGQSVIVVVTKEELINAGLMTEAKENKLEVVIIESK